MAEINRDSLKSCLMMPLCQGLVWLPRVVDCYIVILVNIMKIIIISFVACISLLGTASAGAGNFDGFYIGVKGGYNSSKKSVTSNSTTSNSPYAGGEAGYNWVSSEHILMSQGIMERDVVVFGVNLWADDHTKSVTGRDYGADFKLGAVQYNHTLYYVKLGVAGSNPGTRPHYGLGIEYSFTPHWGVLAEWTGDKDTKNGETLQNNDFVIGMNYHF